ncbi:hypothetical protein ACLB2K_023586 [Fragaria x ananassa]
MSSQAASAQLNHVPSPQQNEFADDEPLPSTTPAAQPLGPRKVTIKTHTETTAIPAADSRPQYPALVSICAPPLEDPDGEGRTPIDLVTVLDVSGSMQGQKLELVKQAVKFVIENLGSSDRLSIVTFSTTARAVFPLRRMSADGREDAIRAINSLRTEDMTNIAAGIKIGSQLLKGRKEKNPVASIILLSDGHDNCSSEAEMLNNLPSSIPSSNNIKEEIPVHAFGFGNDHDPKTMHAISDASGGTFSYIESVGMIQDGFALCIGGLLSVVAQEVRLTIQSASGGVKIVSIPSGRHVNEVSDEGQQGVVHVGNMYAEEVKQFLVYLSVPPSSASDSKTPLLDVSCAYKDPASDELIQVQGERVEISRPEFCSPAEMAVSLEVDRQRNRLLVADAIGEAQRLAEMGNVEGAREVLNQRRETLLASAASKAGDNLSNMFETELKEIMDKMASMKLYQESGRAYALAGMSSHAQQRASARGNAEGSCLQQPAYTACSIQYAMSSRSVEDDSDDDMGFCLFDGADVSPRGAFETPAMVRMKNCAICWNSVTTGQGQAIFTAECSHSFHYLCIANNVQYGNLCCPICRAKWDKNNVPFQVPPLQQNNLGAHGFADDEPRPSTTPAAQSSGPQNVTIKTHTETSSIPAADSRRQYPILVSICAPALQDPDGEARTPIDLVTVLDVSGSMNGRKLDLVKQAVKFVIENMGSSDRLSIVSFSNNSRIVLPLRRMTVDGRESAFEAVESLVAGGGTDIAEALKKGAQILEDRRQRNPVASIILLSDGQDNFCLKPSQMLKKLPASIRSSDMQHEIHVHTFGFGNDHDANIMHAISDESGGTFSYIESVGMIQDAFALCIGGLLSVVAQELRLTVRSASSGVKIVSIPSGRHVSQISDDGLQGVVNIGNMYAEEVKQFLVHLLVPQSSASETKTSLLDGLCVYKDLASNEFIQLQIERVEISRPEFCSPAELAV